MKIIILDDLKIRWERVGGLFQEFENLSHIIFVIPCPVQPWQIRLYVNPQSLLSDSLLETSQNGAGWQFHPTAASESRHGGVMRSIQHIPPTIHRERVTDLGGTCHKLYSNYVINFLSTSLHPLPRHRKTNSNSTSSSSELAQTRRQLSCP